MKKLNVQIEYKWTKKQLELDYIELKSLQKIANKYGVSVTPIKSRFIEFDIPFKTKTHNYSCNHNFFAEQSEYSFYVAGFIAADGCIRVSKTNKNKSYINHRVVISLSDKDIDFLQQLRKIIGCENPIAIYNHNLSKRNSNWNDVRLAKLSITSKQMVENLSQFNIVPNKTFTYKMPDWLMEHPLVVHFMRGYIDGDGSFWISSNSDRKNITFSLRGTIEFLEQIKDIFIKLGIRTTATPKIYDSIGQFTINSNNAVSNIFNLFYKDAKMYLPRKYRIAEKAELIMLVKKEAEEKIQKILRNT